MKFGAVFNFLIVAMSLSAIPIIVILVQQQQVLKSRANTFNNAGKLGFQISCNYPNPEEFEALIAQYPRVIKLMDDWSCAGRIKEISPGTLIVGRIYNSSFDDQNMESFLPDDDVVGKVDEWFGAQEGVIRDNPSVDCWEGPNEPKVFNSTAMIRYANFEAQRANRLAGLGTKACIGNFSVGHPDLSLWSDFFPAIRAAQETGGFLALHEYSAPSMRCDFNDADESGSLTGRYRRIYRAYLSPNNLEIPLIISETGLTALLCSQCGCSESQDTGWRRLTNANSFTSELQWYNSILEQDGYVQGAAIFISGHPGWTTFDLYPEIIGPNGSLISYAGIVIDPTPTSTPTTPAPSPTPTQSIPTPTSFSTPSPTGPRVPTPTTSSISIPTPTTTPIPTSTPVPTITTTPLATTTPRITISPTPTRRPLSQLLPTLPPIFANYDLNKDLKVNSVDVGLFLEDWREQDSEAIKTEDFNKDKLINTLDYSLLVSHLKL